MANISAFLLAIALWSAFCGDSSFAGNTSSSPKAVSLRTVVVNAPVIGIADRDAQVSDKQTISLTYPSTLPNVLEADDGQKILLKFSLKDSVDGSFVRPHQVFVIFSNQKTKQEVIFVAEPEEVPQIDSGESTNPSGSKITVYKFELNLGSRAKDFGSTSGLYDLSLIVGDPSITNSFIWKIASINLSFSTVAKPQSIWFGATWTKIHYGAKPEISHVFRAPDSRPPTVVSDTFTFLVTVPPLFILAILWSKIGINISGFSLTLSALVFHLSVAGIFALYFMFWLQMNMFTTLKCLLSLGVITFLSGHSLLKRKE